MAATPISRLRTSRRTFMAQNVPISRCLRKSQNGYCGRRHRQFMKALWRKGGALLGGWLRGDSCSGASTPWAEGSGSGKSPAGWSSKRVRRGRPPGCPPGSTPPPGRVSLRCLPGIAAVLLRYCCGIAPMLMPSTWEQHRGYTGEIPRIHRGCWLGAMLGAARGFSILRKALATAPSQLIGLASSFSSRPAWHSRRGSVQRKR